jgi:hypothetical protein
MDGREIILGADLRGRISLETHEGVVAIHSAAIVGDPDERDPTALDQDLDVGGAGIDAVLDEFLHHGGGAFDHFTSGDLAGEGFGEESDFSHDLRLCN